MLALVAASAFFSGSEAALFFLSARDRRQMAGGSPAERQAAALLAAPDRLLTAILFWNLVINVTYFAIAAVVGIKLGKIEGLGQSVAVGSAIAFLLIIIFFSEMLPKTVGVLAARSLARAAAFPLSLAVRVVDPVMPTLSAINLLSRRLVWPHFEHEPYLSVQDLERAIVVSTSDAALIEQERHALSNIVALSDIRADEFMRPRNQIRVFAAPVSLATLEGQPPASGYLFVSENGDDEPTAAVRLEEFWRLPDERLERLAEPVVYLPWRVTAAKVLQQLTTRERDVAAIVNEFGETVGVITIDDLVDSLFVSNPSRSMRVLNRDAITRDGDGWLVTGMLSLRRLAQRLKVEFPETHNVTVAGMLQDELQRLPAAGDKVVFGPLAFTVREAPEDGALLAAVRRLPAEGEGPP